MRILCPARAAASATRQNRSRLRSPDRTVPQTSLELGFADPAAAPLAERLRPKTLDEVIGQRHLLGPGKPLRVAFESGRLHSMILWGPPGVGKTTLARLMADAFDAQFIAMSAVLGGVKDIREAVERAQAARTTGRATVVFVDEVHRFNKSQQDAFLPHVESGLLHLHRRDHREPVVRGQLGAAVARHGARAEAARRRRPRRRCSSARRRCSRRRRSPTPRATRLIGYADGDARRLLNAYENLVATVRAQQPATRRSTADGRSDADRRTHARARARRAAAPLRQGRRAVLRHHLGAAQGGARQRPRCVAVLVRPHDRRRRRPALRGAPPGADGERGHRPGRSARAAPRARCRRDLRAARLARGRAGARRGGRLPGDGAEEQRRLHAPTTRRAPSSRTTAPGRCRCACAMRRRR